MDCKKLIFVKEFSGKGQKEFVAEVAKKTLAYMSQHRIDITPVNYEEWFYVLCTAIQEGHRLSENNLQILHDKYFKDSAEIEDIKEIRELSTNLKKLAFGSEKALDKFEDNINNHARYIDESIEAIEQEDIPKIHSLKENIAKLEEENSKLKRYLEQNRKQLELIEEKFSEQKREAEHDALTGLLNRRSFDKDIEALEKSDSSYSVIIADIDNFKKINDTYGHLIGDEILKMMGAVLQNYVRKDTKAYRYGGEEFVVLLPNADKKVAHLVAERIRHVIENKGYQVEQNGYIHFTASFGATQRQEGESAKEVLERADKALYKAKKEGKNRVVIL